jgi:PleD family two-component response regulator
MDAPALRVLVVSTDAATVDLLARSLQRHKRFEVSAVLGVEDALDVLCARLPDAILVELTLSIVSGHTLLHRVRQTPESARLPVFMLTGRHDGASIKAAAHAGASGFIPRPLNGTEISYKIEQAVHGRGARAAEVIDLLQPDPTPDEARARHHRSHAPPDR